MTVREMVTVRETEESLPVIKDERNLTEANSEKHSDSISDEEKVDVTTKERPICVRVLRWSQY